MRVRTCADCPQLCGHLGRVEIQDVEVGATRTGAGLASELLKLFKPADAPRHILPTNPGYFGDGGHAGEGPAFGVRM